MDDIVIDKASNLNVSAVVRPPTFERNISTLVKGGGITFAGKMFLSASRLVIAVLLARLLGAEQYGLYNLAISAGALATGLALLGLDTALVRYVAIFASRRDEAGLWGALQAGLGISTFLSVLTGTAIFALAYPIAEQVFHAPGLVPLLQLIGVLVPFLTLSEMLAGANRGFKKMEYPVIAQFVAQPLFRLILTVALALVGLNAALAVLIYGVSDLVASIIMLYFLNKLFALKRPLRAARRDVRAILDFSIPFWFSNLVTTFRGNLQILFVGAFNSVAGVGIFSVADNLNLTIGMFNSSINTSAKPIMAELHDRGDVGQMGRIYQMLTKWSFTLSLPIFLVMALFPGPILSIFGESFTGGTLALVILAFENLVNVGTGMGGIILDMTGYTKLKLVNSVVRLILFTVLDVLLIPRWGIVGAALAALAAEGTVNVLRLIQVYILFRLLPYNRSFAKPIVAGVAALTGALVVGTWLPAEPNILVMAIYALIILAVYGGLILLLRLSPEERAMLARLRRRARALFSRS